VTDAARCSAQIQPNDAVRAIRADGADGRAFGTSPPLSLSFPLFFGLHSLDDWNTLIPLRYLQFTAGKETVEAKAHTVDRSILSSVNRARLARLRYVYLSGRDAQELSPHFLPFTAGDGWFLYRDPDPFPRAFLVPDALGIRGVSARLAALDGPGFDPRRTVILDEDPPVGHGGGAGRAEIVSESPARLEIRTSADGDSWLVLLDAHHPGWSATVDGAPIGILPAYHAFRAVRVHGGEHKVVFTFRSGPLLAGAVISATTFFVSVFALWMSRHGKRRHAVGAAA
jgi:hypothetical protein